MTAKEFNEQINMCKALRNKENKLTLRFVLKYNATRYELYGIYQPKVDIVEWHLFKYKNDNFVKGMIHPESNNETPLSILKIMVQVERLVTKGWREVEKNIWHNEVL